jgi:hypothetical protein
LVENDSILVVVDCLISGNELARYSEYLRNYYKGKINYIIGVARPESHEELNKRISELEYRTGGIPHQVTIIEKVLLPDWEPEKCVWCHEKKELINYLPTFTGDFRVVIENRITALSGTEGLRDNCFWRKNGNKGLKISPDSIFMNVSCASDADIIAAVSCFLQEIRTHLEIERLEFSYPHISLLNHTEYLGARFSDLVLRTAFLRCAYKSELVNTIDQREYFRSRYVKNKLIEEHVDSTTFRLEYIVAKIAGKLPAVHLTEEELKNISSCCTYQYFKKDVSGGILNKIHINTLYEGSDAIGKHKTRESSDNFTYQQMLNLDEGRDG